jgi:Mor family transcriptional regulator
MTNHAMDETAVKLSDIGREYRTVCEVIGLEKGLELAKAMGGDRIYVPRLESLLNKIKYRRIRRDFDGGNYRELARKYGYTVRWIRMIVNNPED